MISMKQALRVGTVSLAFAAGFVIAPMSLAQPAQPWINKDDNWASNKEKLRAYGEQFNTSWEMFEHLRKSANGGKSPTWQQLAGPAFDWSGIYTAVFSLSFDAELPRGGDGVATAKLTPAARAVVKAKADALARTGGEYDPLSKCGPPGVPRWFAEPFLREAVVTPQQTLLINELMNDVRRVYTDGRAHTPDEDAYGTPDGDTIGFWDGDVLVAHTKHLIAGQFQRGVQPDYSDQVTVVERWRKVGQKMLQADVWVFDPVNLAKPWYARHTWNQLTNDDYQLRIRYWDCSENPNNTVIKEDDGTSQFKEFTFQ